VEELWTAMKNCLSEIWCKSRKSTKHNVYLKDEEHICDGIQSQKLLLNQAWWEQ